jgi:hypothetical protein
MKITKKIRIGLCSLLIAALIFVIASFGAFATLEENAVVFNQYVAQISATQSLYEKSAYLAAAEEILSAYIEEGGTVEDEAIAEAYTEYISIKDVIETAVEASENFIYYVGEASTANDYASMREALDNAAAAIDGADDSYDGVAYSRAMYNNTRAKISEAERLCDSYIESASKIPDSKNHGDMQYKVDSAKKLREAKLFAEFPGILDEYEGVAEADEIIANAEAKLAQDLLDAAPFLVAVREIGQAESIPLGIKAAEAALEGIDKTIAGVPEAMNDLNTIKGSYNSKVKNANKLSDQAFSIILGLLP